MVDAGTVLGSATLVDGVVGGAEVVDGTALALAVGGGGGALEEGGGAGSGAGAGAAEGAGGGTGVLEGLEDEELDGAGRPGMVDVGETTAVDGVAAVDGTPTASEVTGERAAEGVDEEGGTGPALGAATWREEPPEATTTVAMTAAATTTRAAAMRSAVRRRRPPPPSPPAGLDGVRGPPGGGEIGGCCSASFRR